MNKAKLTREDIEQELDKIFNLKSNFKMSTGRKGAINYEIELRAQLNPTKPKSEIEKEVNSEIWEEGTYNIDDSGCNYIGLWDNTKRNGIYLVRRNGLVYLENWVNKYRYEYQIISEEIANLLKNKETIQKGLKLVKGKRVLEIIQNILDSGFTKTGEDVDELHFQKQITDKTWFELTLYINNALVILESWMQGDKGSNYETVFEGYITDQDFLNQILNNGK